MLILCCSFRERKISTSMKLHASCTSVLIRSGRSTGRTGRAKRCASVREQWPSTSLTRSVELLYMWGSQDACDWIRHDEWSSLQLALRAGNEKDEDTADTVGCCSLRVEHIRLHEKMDDKEYVVEFDFPGKDSIRYYNKVAVEKRVFKNLQLFMENKGDGDDLFDRLNVSVSIDRSTCYMCVSCMLLQVLLSSFQTHILNKHLSSLMEGLTAKVFRTYNASRTLQEQLKLLTDGQCTFQIMSQLCLMLCCHCLVCIWMLYRSGSQMYGVCHGGQSPSRYKTWNTADHAIFPSESSILCWNAMREATSASAIRLWIKSFQGHASLCYTLPGINGGWVSIEGCASSRVNTVWLSYIVVKCSQWLDRKSTFACTMKAHR